MLTERMKISAIVCAYNEAEFLPACLHSLFSQTRPPDEVIVVNNASSDHTAAVAAAIPGVRVVDEPVKGLVVAREAGRRQSTGHVLAYVDADCRAPLQWLERVEQRFERHPAVVAVTRPYRFYDWDFAGRLILRAYDAIVAPPTHVLVHYFIGAGAIFYGGNFASAPGCARSHWRLRSNDRVSWRGHRSRAPADPARVDSCRARVLDLDVGAPLSGARQTKGLWPLRQEFLVRDPSSSTCRP